MKKYTSDIFLHFDDEVTSENNDSLERASFIIETGFNLFIILSNYMEISKDSENEVMVKGNEDQDKDLMAELTSSIIGKVIILAIDIV